MPLITVAMFTATMAASRTRNGRFSARARSIVPNAGGGVSPSGCSRVRRNMTTKAAEDTAPISRASISQPSCGVGQSATNGWLPSATARAASAPPQTLKVASMLRSSALVVIAAESEP